MKYYIAITPQADDGWAARAYTRPEDRQREVFWLLHNTGKTKEEAKTKLEARIKHLNADPECYTIDTEAK